MRWELSKQVTSIESRSPVKAVSIVENYVKANPDMTNAQKFELVFGFPHDYPTQKEWWNELVEEISHLQSEVAFRKESDVRECVYAFYNTKRDEQNPSPTPKPTNPSIPPVAPTPPPPAIPTPTNSVKKTISPESIKKAKNLVKEANMPGVLWQKVVLDIIDNNPEVAEFISNYLS